MFITGCTSRKTPEKPAPLRIMLKVGDHFKSDENPYIKQLEKISGTSLEVEAPSSSSYNERLNVVMASGKIPDIVQLNWMGESNFTSWVKQGLVKPIDIDKAVNIQENVSVSLLNMMKLGGDDKLYGVPGITSRDYYGVIVRQDWLQKLKKETPRTLQDFVEVMNAFTTYDPDGNGKKDTMGFTSWRLNHFGGVFGSAFGIDYLWNSLHPDFSGADSIVKLREEQDGYMPFMDFARKMYSEGSLDKEFSYVQNAEDKFVMGKVGMIGAYSTQVIALEKRLQRFVPTAKLEWIPCSGDKDGKIWEFMPEPYGVNGAGSQIGSNAIFFISRDADYDKALKFLDLMHSKEIIHLSNLGIEGIHYQYFDDNRGILVRDEKMNELVKRDIFGMADTFRGERQWYLGDNMEENERLNYYWKKSYLLVTNPLCFNMTMVPEYVKFNQENPTFKEKERLMAMKYVSGSITRDEYLNYLKDENIKLRKSLSSELQSRYKQMLGQSK